MAKKRLVLNLPANLIDQPLTYQLIKKYDLMVNILRARVTPNEEGRLTIEISGKKSNLEEGLRFIRELGVSFQPLAQEVRWREERCIACTACTSVCPTGALNVTRPEMHVAFTADKCIACELCLPVCPYRAMEIIS
jgi:L-aspartate semialdehyde sulfurtransferase ferredoxin